MAMPGNIDKATIRAVRTRYLSDAAVKLIAGTFRFTESDGAPTMDVTASIVGWAVETASMIEIDAVEVVEREIAGLEKLQADHDLEAWEKTGAGKVPY